MTVPSKGLPDIVIRDSSSDTDSAALQAALLEFNRDVTGYRDDRVLSCFIHDDHGTLVAGIEGFTWGRYARIEYLWIHDALRGNGLGRRLLLAAEDEARNRGCVKIVLDTHSFQAPGFYRSLGYREVSTTLDTPVGFTDTLFEKSL